MLCLVLDKKKITYWEERREREKEYYEWIDEYKKSLIRPKIGYQKQRKKETESVDEKKNKQ